MNRPRVSVAVALCALVLLLVCPDAEAVTTDLDVRLGDSFTGSIATAGVDTVQAHFPAPAGTPLRISFEAARGSSLRPTIEVLDPSGSPIVGTTVDLGFKHASFYHYFTTNAAGRYTAVIGASSGSGTFWAQLSGSPSDVVAAEVSGTVTNSRTSGPISGASVLVDDAPFATTGASGTYSGNLLAGSYSVRFEATGFLPETRSLTVSSSSPVTLSVALTPDTPLSVDARVTGDPVFGGALTGSIGLETSAGTVFSWTQVFGPPVVITNGNTATPTITLGSLEDYKVHLMEVLAEPPVGPEQLPPNVPYPPGEFVGGIQNRLQVVGVSPLSREEGGLVRLKVEVTTEDGTLEDEVEIHTEIPWKVSTGLRNVSLGAPVLLHAREASDYLWTLDPPPGSLAALTDANTRNPYFTPDISGLYDLTVSDGVSAATETLQVYAGTWRGIIVGEDIDGRPVPDPGCLTCHNDDPDEAADKFTPWVQTGHAEIFSDSLNTNSHYSSNCFPCHTVGYDPEANSSGIDEADDYSAFYSSGLISNPNPNNWSTVVENYPETARLGNIQCENCHGPQDSFGHGFFDPTQSRLSLSSDVCATCHGEPLRHARFQQWQLSGHANYELAIDESQSGSCSRCHTANGFLTWLPILRGEQQGNPLDDITVSWTEDEAHPQTCVTCHDPHAVGTSSGNDPDVTIRISGDTPPLIGGFQATNVGSGAICMTCHNSRRGLYNDSTYDALRASGDHTRAPHPGVQSDVLMGQNAFFVQVGVPGGHGSELEDTCVDCHMKATPPPDVLSYNRGGLNHTFYASPEICADCHSPYLKASDVQDGVHSLLDQVNDLIQDRLIGLFDSLIQEGNVINVGGAVTITDADQVESIELSETRGRQALIMVIDGTTYGPTSVTSIRSVGPTPGAIYDLAPSAIVKAGWNWTLIHGDGSFGVHNPFFATKALIAARDALVTLPVGGRVRAVRTIPAHLPTTPVIERTRPRLLEEKRAR